MANLIDLIGKTPDEANAIRASQDKAATNGERFVRFTERQFDVTGTKLNGESKTIRVGNGWTKRTAAELRREGYGKVDIVEVVTMVNEKVGDKVQMRKMEFAKPAANMRKVTQQPFEKVPGIVEDIQLGLNLFPNPGAFLNDTPRPKISDMQNKRKVESKRREIFRKMNPVVIRDGWKVFDKEGHFLFSSNDEMEVVTYIKENGLTINDIVLYVPENVYQWLKQNLG